MMKTYVPAAAAVTLLCFSATGWAQDVLVEGPGVKVGEATVLHPRVGAEAGVVSNVFYEEASEKLAPIMRLLAALDITPSGRQRLGPDADAGTRTVEFKGGVELEYQEYLTPDEDVRAQRHLDANAIASLHFFPDSNASFRVGDKFTRQGRPTNFESSENLTRDVNHFIAEFGVHPRGRTISGALRYENIIDVFESDRSEFANRMQHILGANGKWKFYPYSQVWLDASIGFYGALGDNDLMGVDYKIGSNPLRLLAGIDTLLTTTLTAKAYAGYANGFYETGPSYNIVVGGANIGWRYLPVGRLGVGYAYDVKDSINANYYGEHHLFSTIQHTIREVLQLSSGVGVRFRGYRGIPMQLMPSDTSRDDTIVEATARAAWLLKDRFSLYAEYALQLVETDFRQGTGAGADDPSYVRQEAVVGLVAAF